MIEMGKNFAEELIETAGVFIAVLDPEGYIKLYNKGAEEITGYSKDETIGKRFMDVFVPDTYKRDAYRKFKDCIEGSIIKYFDIPVIAKNGEELVLSFNAAGVRDENGNLTEVIVTAQDVTEKRRLEKELKDTIEKLKASQEELSTPVVKVWDRILVLPLIGMVDSLRAQRIMETLLNKIVETGSEMVIMDITGVASVDTEVANHLIKTVHAANLLGAECVVTGVRPDVAQTIVHLGVEISDSVTKRDLQEGLRYALKKLGYEIGKKG